MKYVIVGDLVVGRNPKLDGEYYYFETNSVHKDSCLVVEHEDVGEGYLTYSYTSDTGLFNEEGKEPIPTSITPRQIRLHLTSIGLRQAVEDYVASASLDIKDWWEFSTFIERTSPLLINAATQLGMTSEQLDQFFIEASNL